MKKPGIILIGGATALVALALLGPPVLGVVAESQVGARIEAMSRNGVMTADLLSFERGWFSSTARIALGLAPEYAAQLAALGGDTPAADVEELLQQRATIVVDMTHGPVAIDNGVHLGLSTIVARLDAEAHGLEVSLERLGIPYLFEFRGRTGFDGGLEFDADIPPIELIANGEQLRFSGARIDGSFAGRNLVTRAAVESLNIASRGQRFALQGFNAAGAHELRARYLVLGTADIAIDRVQVWDTVFSPEPMLDATDARFAMATRTDRSGTLLSGEATYAIGGVSMGGDARLTNASVGTAVTNVDVAAMQAYIEATRRLAIGDATDPLALVAELEPSIRRLMASSPSISFDPIRFTWDGEPFVASVALETDASALPPLAVFDVRDQDFWLEFLTVTARANVSKMLAQDIATEAIKVQLGSLGPSQEPTPNEQLDYMSRSQASLVLVALVAQGVLMDDGMSYSTELKLANGELTVHGKPLPLGLP